VFSTRFFSHSGATANFLFKNGHLVTTATGRYGVNFNGIVKLCNLCNRLYGTTFVLLSHISANYVLKFPNFRCHGNEGRSGVNFSDVVKLPDLDNPLIGATFLAQCLILAELWLILCESFHIFVTMATGVGLI